MSGWRRSRVLREHRNQGAFARLRPTRRALAYAVGAAFTASAPISFANPSGASVAAGGVTFSVSGNLLTITNTPGTIIQWQGFNILPGEITRFVQQNSNSAVLNRVVGQDPSRILGSLQSNGRVYVINPNGILFGANAQVDVGGLVASTLNITNEDFTAGRQRFSAAPGAGSVANQGTIRTSSGGHIYLIAPNVENSGVLESPRGHAAGADAANHQRVPTSRPDFRARGSQPD